MTTFNDKLKSICNYSEKDNSMGPIARFMYMDMAVKGDDAKREMQRKKRDLTIDTILGEADEDAEDAEDYASDIYSESIVCPRIMSISMTPSAFFSDKHLYAQVVGFLEKNTQKKHRYPTCLDFSPIAYSEPESVNCVAVVACIKEINFRHIVSKIAHASNFIATDGRIGQATSVIVGRNCWHWFENENVGNLLIVLDDCINPDKIIVARGGSIDSSGIICVKNNADNTYYLKETHGWEKQYAWFMVK
jgi:hypothetical protein